MTKQASEILNNEHPRVQFGELRLYGLVRWDPASQPHPPVGCSVECTFDYPLPPRPRDHRGGFATCCYRGVIAEHTLHPDGSLTLDRYIYPFAGPEAFDMDETDEHHAPIDGDFWLMLRDDFYSQTITYVPFRGGRIVEDRAAWHIETRQPMTPEQRDELPKPDAAMRERMREAGQFMEDILREADD